jgi:hypothetical protein
MKYNNGERIQLLDEVVMPTGTTGKVVGFDNTDSGEWVVVGCYDTEGNYFRCYVHPEDLKNGRELQVMCECDD